VALGLALDHDLLAASAVALPLAQYCGYGLCWREMKHPEEL